MKIPAQHLKWNDGDLFFYRTNVAFYADLNGVLGIVLGKGDGRNGRVYKARVAHMTLWVGNHNMERL